jgi:hypothetical protein
VKRAMKVIENNWDIRSLAFSERNVALPEGKTRVK